MYQKYSTALKTYYALGLQNEFVDKKIRNKIPASTCQEWKNSVIPDTIIGYELEEKFKKNKDDIQAVYHPVNKFPRYLFFAYSRFIVMLVGLFDKNVFQKTIRDQKAKVIDFLNEFSEHISYKEAGKLLSVSSKTLHHWKKQVKFRCSASPIHLCVKSYLNQASTQEVNTIKKYLNKTDLAHWCLASIWAKAFKNGDTLLSRSTWYQYNQLLKIRIRSKKGKKPSYNPIRSGKVNEIWHADITVFKTLDGVRHFIYTVMDNFSRFVHSWRIERVVSAKIRLETIQEALKNCFGDDHFEDLRLITDGGPENDNLTIKQFIDQCHSLHHDIALKDIEQSNSMMEAFYHISKYRYLYNQPIQNGTELQNIFTEMMHEYHTIKPHYALGIYTPEEVLNGADPKAPLTEIFRKAAVQRRATNKKAQCELNCG